jgi:hypothetical protein
MQVTQWTTSLINKLQSTFRDFQVTVSFKVEVYVLWYSISVLIHGFARVV